MDNWLEYLLYERFPNAVLHVLLIGLPGLIVIFVCYCFYNNIRKHAFFQRCTLPGLTANPLGLYASILYVLYKIKAPPLCIMLQTLHAICRAFDKERIVRIYLFFTPAVIFYKPETVEVVLSSTVIDKGEEYRLLSPWLGTGLLTSTGKKWRFRRKLLTPTFHFSILEDFFSVFYDQSNVLISKLQALEGSWIDIRPLMTSCTLDIICQTAMGLNINAQSGQNDEYVKAIEEIGEIFMYRILRPWLYPETIFRLTSTGRKFFASVSRVKALTRKVIKDKKAEIIANRKLNPVVETAPDGNPMLRKKRKAFLELLMEYHLKDPTFTEEDIREEVDTFMFEGHDTTAMSISWALYSLGSHPDIQKTAQEELDDIFEDDIERDIRREDLPRMKYLECVIKESLRLYPAVPLIARKTKQPFKVLNYTVHAGSLCVIFPQALHLDEGSFPDPERFNPERFFPENITGRHPYAYVPFSAGPRNCIGQKFALMEEKTVLANILRKFRITSLDPRDKILQIPSIVTRSVLPIRIRFEAR
ncbi:cytochrome P450 4C1 [Caerostris darwini]|uniref:Cytochrome P450 4C1 n=1 Tax=Caerostris darwini TaxID=1538125 RepID=A0AAV4VRX2_9ARAC|nr:cytochrome P450 4C1 [Caerostris darwini]